MLRIGTRGSQLALWQARAVAAQLEATAHARCELVTIRTGGDRLADAALGEVSGKRLFVKELEDALVAGSIDLAVHSAKDMSATLPDGLVLAAVLPREDPRDALILPTSRRPPTAGAALGSLLGRAPKIGTSSVRRVAQLHRAFPDATFEAIRGNVDTRLRKLDEGQFDAIVLAAAGLRRLGFNDRISALIPADVSVPAPGQGTIAVQSLANRDDVREPLARISDVDSWAMLEAERALVAALGGGCQIPLGALARLVDAETLELSAVVTSLDEEHEVRAVAFGGRREAAALGNHVAEELLDGGAGAILEAIRDLQAPVKGLQP
ncbi:MAG: hydroxymethylbilane synthase [Luteitalea sp.]|nr:hydroxymethylbilane synthase [Luteitalea sp.]